MAVNLSIKGVPDALAASLRTRAARNHRSLQRELLAIIEVAAARQDAYRSCAPTQAGDPAARDGEPPAGRMIEDVIAELHDLFPRADSRGASSTQIIRALRDGRHGDEPGRERPDEHDR
jgi:plasmid stability protein